MAQVLAEEPRGKRGRYPWDKWTDGQWWHATPGNDFHISVANFQASLHVRARAIGKRVETKTVENGVAFRFFTEVDVQDETDYGDVTDL